MPSHTTRPSSFVEILEIKPLHFGHEDGVLKPPCSKPWQAPAVAMDNKPADFKAQFRAARSARAQASKSVR